LLISIESQPTVATATQDVAGGLSGAPADSTARFGREQLAIEADFGELKEQANMEIWAYFWNIYISYNIINIINIYAHKYPFTLDIHKNVHFRESGIAKCWIYKN